MAYAERAGHRAIVNTMFVFLLYVRTLGVAFILSIYREFRSLFGFCDMDRHVALAAVTK